MSILFFLLIPFTTSSALSQQPSPNLSTPSSAVTNTTADGTMNATLTSPQSPRYSIQLLPLHINQNLIPAPSLLSLLATESTHIANSIALLGISTPAVARSGEYTATHRDPDTGIVDASVGVRALRGEYVTFGLVQAVFGVGENQLAVGQSGDGYGEMLIRVWARGRIVAVGEIARGEDGSSDGGANGHGVANGEPISGGAVSEVV